VDRILIVKKYINSKKKKKKTHKVYYIQQGQSLKMGGIHSSQKHQKKGAILEYVHSAKNDSKNNSIPLMISNRKVLDCCSCFQLLSIPVYQVCIFLFYSRPVL
jgi:hypothetical protein